MVLIIGGQASGKRTYARQALGFSEADMADALLDERPVLYNLQDLVARDPAGSLALLDALCQKSAVLCNEVGSGVIPMSEEGRAAREATGRLCILLAERAESVVRMVSGIPQLIKGTGE